ncbi:MAG: hypothetical protein GOV15_00200 [Candidatus Diapherotrites archaeon]|nr:hypothetical protein [Candidatus Diapherotrites archaeon]
MVDYFRWWGHSFVEVSLNNTPFLIDPFMDNNPEPMTRLVKCPASPSDFNDVATIFVTSELFDHLDVPAIEKVAFRNNSLIVGPEHATRQLGVPGQFIESHAVGDAFRLLNLDVSVTDSMNSDSSYPVGFIVRSGGASIFHPGSTKMFRGLNRVNNIDIAFLPIGGRFSMDPVDAVQAAKLIKPQVVVPIQYNTFSKIKQDVDIFVKRMAESAPNIQVVVPKIGERVEF